MSGKLREQVGAVLAANIDVSESTMKAAGGVVGFSLRGAADAAIRLIAEECAKVAEEFVGNGTTMYQTGAAVCARNIATRIRSLADKETGE